MSNNIQEIFNTFARERENGTTWKVFVEHHTNEELAFVKKFFPKSYIKSEGKIDYSKITPEKYPKLYIPYLRSEIKDYQNTLSTLYSKLTDAINDI